VGSGGTPTTNSKGRKEISENINILDKTFAKREMEKKAKRERIVEALS